MKLKNENKDEDFSHKVQEKKREVGVPHKGLCQSGVRGPGSRYHKDTGCVLLSLQVSHTLTG